MPLQFMVDIEGTELSEFDQELLKHPNVGSVILFTRNFTNRDQLCRLVQTINATNPNLFIATDHEGGIVQRFQRHGFSSLPAARVYGQVYDKNKSAGITLAQEYGEIMAKELLACGIDLSLAPVLDVHDQSEVISSLDRAFHQDPEAIVDLATAFILGMNSAGMPAVGKHFPGHGSVLSDSHVSMPVCQASLDELENKDLKPFKKLIEKNLLAAVMPAYVIYEAIDKTNPAGFSKKCLHDILRKNLGFTGLVISDCLSMKGADVGDLMTRAEMALHAGCDLLIVCNQPRAVLMDLIHKISIPQSVDSLNRIHQFKNQMVYFSSKTKTIYNSGYYNENKPQDSTIKTSDEENGFNRTLTV